MIILHCPVLSFIIFGYFLHLHSSSLSIFAFLFLHFSCVAWTNLCDKDTFLTSMTINSSYLLETCLDFDKPNIHQFNYLLQTPRKHKRSFVLEHLVSASIAISFEETNLAVSRLCTLFLYYYSHLKSLAEQRLGWKIKELSLFPRMGLELKPAEHVSSTGRSMKLQAS